MDVKHTEPQLEVERVDTIADTVQTREALRGVVTDETNDDPPAPSPTDLLVVKFGIHEKSKHESFGLICREWLCPIEDEGSTHR